MRGNRSILARDLPPAPFVATATQLAATVDWTAPVVPLYNSSGQLVGILAFTLDNGAEDLTYYPSTTAGAIPSFSATNSTLLVSSATMGTYLRIDTSREGVVNSGGSVIFFEVLNQGFYKLYRIDANGASLAYTSGGPMFSSSQLPAVRDDSNIYFGVEGGVNGNFTTAWYSYPIAGGTGVTATLLNTSAPYTNRGDYTLVDTDGTYLLVNYGDYTTPAYSLQRIPVRGGSASTLFPPYTDANTAGIQAYLDYSSHNVFINHLTENLTEPYAAPDSRVINLSTGQQVGTTVAASRYLVLGNTLLTTQSVILQLTGLTASSPASDQGAAVVSVPVNTTTGQGSPVTVAGGSAPYTLPTCVSGAGLDMWLSPAASGFYAGYLVPQNACNSGNEIGILIDTTKNQGVMTPLSDSLFLF